MNTTNSNVYILGPMRGIPHYNFPAFDDMAEELRRSGWNPFNPADLDRGVGFNPFIMPLDHDWNTIPASLPIEGIIDRDLDALRACGSYICLPGWENSTGARAEKGVLDWQGAKRLVLETSSGGPSLQAWQEPVNDLKPTNAKDRAATHRLDMSLFPMTAIAYGALGMTEGDCKYAGFNYRVGGVSASIYIAAAARHMAKWYNGEDHDAKTHVPHMASALSCLAIIIDSIECKVLQDDRPPKVDGIAHLFERFEETVKHLHTIFPNGPARFTEQAFAKKS